jgi:RNA polymerase sigma-70 factor (ECF subfamily)
MVASQPSPSDCPQQDRTDEDEYVRLIVKHQGLLFAYLRTILESPADAEDVLQETCVVLWRKRHQFVVGTSFVNWATTIAQYTVRRYRRTRKPQLLNDELLDQISAEMAAELIADNDLIDARHRALMRCMDALSERDRNLINAIYRSKASKKVVSDRLGMSVNGLYKALNRIRQRLQKCIEYRLVAEGNP